MPTAFFIKVSRFFLSIGDDGLRILQNLQQGDGIAAGGRAFLDFVVAGDTFFIGNGCLKMQIGAFIFENFRQLDIVSGDKGQTGVISNPSHHARRGCNPFHGIGTFEDFVDEAVTADIGLH